ncbi:serine phosphatase RsbU (regulator of sigma subunit) [Sediminihabitans luteus]|uniref:Serine phosphatase RsbU (Regulator of sigma subunit) n=1 Tax=Sediminihabitans luteus TaxID=1138585 RepID=A0A2M9CCL9_9CELL|nr:SpoIIE family protein phosphatase [Sediminihabitans luteus]PJJ69063.1 serine phosphatase RsbU (regulator of sigma subunit) [Sediminihabitans luteus]GII99449.1 serine/threonine phosphatase [Sediminihabitans luteus]
MSTPGVPLLSSSDELRILLVEDDEGDAVIVEELLHDTGLAVDLVRARTLDEAISVLESGPVTCVLLDLGLPDSVGLGGLARVNATPAAPALVVLTGLGGTDAGVQAVAAGADDYLVKGEVDGELLGRSVRYAVQRRRSEVQQRELFRSQLRAAETTRLERALLPRPLVHDGGVSVLVGYVPGGNGLLGGDFYDAIERPDGSVVCVIGDVAGHGPDEAALGATLRTAWRTLVLAGTPAHDVVGLVERVLLVERPRPEIFATLCQVVIAADRTRAQVYIAGHLAPLHLGAGPCVEVSASRRGRALGVPVAGGWESVEVELAAPWALMLYTDGLVEATVEDSLPVAPDGPRPRRRRIGVDGLRQVVDATRGAGEHGLVDRVLHEVRRVHGGDLVDDAAALVVGWNGTEQGGERASTHADSAGWAR